MKKLFLGFLAILFLSFPVYADTIVTIKNESGLPISVFIDSVDHGQDKYGSRTIIDRYLEIGESINVTIQQSNPPYRYIFSTLYKKKYNLEIVKINPDIKTYLFLIKSENKIIGEIK